MKEIRLTTWDAYNPVNNGIFAHINWCRISFINRMKCIITVFAHAETDLDLSLFLIRDFETATRIRRVFGSLKVDSTFQQKPDPKKNTCLKRKLA